MADAFDSYHVWLGIPPEEQPPNQYRLLGIRLYEDNPDVIDSAADRQMAHLRTFQTGPHALLSQRLLNEVSAARVSLLNPETKAAYDRRLRAETRTAASPAGSGSAIGRGAAPTPGGSRIGPRRPANLPVAPPIPTAPPIAPSLQESDWDAVMGTSPGTPRAATVKSVQAIAVRRKSGSGLKFLAAGIGAVAAVAIGIAFWMLARPAEAVLKFDWPVAERTSVVLAIDDQAVVVPAAGSWEVRCAAGEHRITAERPAYRLDQTVTLDAGEERAIAAEWKPKALLVLNWPIAERAGAAILLDGHSQPASQRDIWQLAVEPGRHVVRITRAESEPFEAEVAIANDQRANVTVVLPRWPTLVLDLPIEERPEATLSIDNAPVAVDSDAVPLDFHLKPGEHTIHVARPGFKPFDQVVSLAAGGTEPISPTWEPLATTSEPASGKTTVTDDPAAPNKPASGLEATASVKKRPIPAAAAQAESLKSVKEVFAREYALKTAAGQVALAEKLFDAALDTKDKPTDRFVLLLEAREAAVRAGDPAAALCAIDQLDDEFAIDPIPLKAKSLMEIAKLPTMPEDNRTALLEALTAIIAESIATDQFDVAQQLVAASKPLARKPADKQFAARLDSIGKDIPLIQKCFEEIKPALAILKQKPDDPDANLTVGKFLCYWKGNWDEGLPMIAKGSDAKLREIAAQEWLHPQESVDQAQLGDAWWALAETETEPIAGRLKLRAATWYAQAIPGLGGLSKGKAEKRLKEVEAKTTVAAPPHSHEIDLLKLIDIKRDAVRGTWELDKGRLICKSAEELSRLEIPYHPPQEYDFQMTFARIEGHECVMQICAAADRQFRWVIDGFDEHITGFDDIGGVSANKNPTAKILQLTNARKYESVVKVRRDGVQAYLDGELVDEWKTDYKDMSLLDVLRLRGQTCLGLGTWESPTIFYSVKVTEITGVGKRLR